MIYLDNAATTKPSRRAMKVAKEAMENEWFNPSSLYEDADKVSKSIELSRQIISDLVGFESSHITFTSGATEGNNTVLSQDWDWIITTPIEHDSVYNTALSKGTKTLFCDVDNEGHINCNMLENILHTHRGKILVSVIAVNNEIGTIQKIGKISDIVHSRPDCYLHIDATQCMGKMQLSYNLADYVTASAHKFHGLKGVGFIAHKPKLISYLKGGHQESNQRAGTENVPGILSMSETLQESYNEIYHNFNKIKEFRDVMLSKILVEVPYTKVNSDNDNPYIINISFKDIESESLISLLSLKGIYVSSGSACNSHEIKVSRVLKSINVPGDYINGTIRISFSSDNTCDEIKFATEEIISCIKSIRHSRGAGLLG